MPAKDLMDRLGKEMQLGQWDTVRGMARNLAFFIKFVMGLIYVEIAEIAIVMFFVRKSIVMPTEIIAYAMDRYAAGTEKERMESAKYVHRMNINTGDELEGLYHSFEKMVDDFENYLERLKKENDLKRALEVEKEANVAKSAFLSNMSHELRTPINAVLGMDEMILRESEDENINRYAADKRNAGKSRLGLVNDITYEAVDKTAVNNIVNAGKQTVATSKIIKDIEEVLSNDRAALETEFVKAARVSGLNICHSNLSAPYDENNFYPAAWAKIGELDTDAKAAFDEAKTIKQVDAAITNNKALYSTIVSKSVVDLYKNDLTKAYQKYNESDYTAENWATLTGYYNTGLSDLETSITTKEAETKNKEVKAQMKAVPKK